MRCTMVANGAVSENEMELITVTDDVDEVVDIMVAHRKHKKKLIAEAEQLDD